jgi:hypothetical protein
MLLIAQMTSNRLHGAAWGASSRAQQHMCHTQLQAEMATMSAMHPTAMVVRMMPPLLVMVLTQKVLLHQHIMQQMQQRRGSTAAMSGQLSPAAAHHQQQQLKRVGRQVAMTAGSSSRTHLDSRRILSVLL